MCSYVNGLFKLSPINSFAVHLLLQRWSSPATNLIYIYVLHYMYWSTLQSLHPT